MNPIGIWHTMRISQKAELNFKPPNMFNMLKASKCVSESLQLTLFTSNSPERANAKHGFLKNGIIRMLMNTGY